MYADLPSRQSKLPVPTAARSTTDDETRLVAPAALQAALDDLMAAVRRAAASCGRRAPRTSSACTPRRRPRPTPTRWRSRRRRRCWLAGGGREADRRVATYKAFTRYLALSRLAMKLRQQHMQQQMTSGITREKKR